MNDILTKRPISHDEAREALQRFVHSHFRDGREVARIGIPARPDYDDDLVLAAYIEQQRAADPKSSAIADVVQLQPDQDCPGLWIGFQTDQDRDAAMNLFRVVDSQPPRVKQWNCDCGDDECCPKCLGA